MRETMKRRDMIEIEKNLLPTIDRQIYHGLRLVSGDIVNSKVVSNAVRRTLGVEYEKVLEDGTVVQTSVIQEIVNATIKDAIENPKMSKLKDLATITGEIKQDNSVNVNMSNTPSKLFGDFVYDVEVIDGEITEK